MRTENYTRRRWTYSFRCWIDERGFNVDRQHEKSFRCQLAGRCDHIRLWDLNTAHKSRNLLRIVRRRKPFVFSVAAGPRYWRVINIHGRKRAS